MDEKKYIKSNGSVASNLFATLVLASLFTVVSFALFFYLDRIHADEPVVFGSLGGLLLLMLTVILFHWFRHRLTLLSAVQGAIIFSGTAFPFFRHEPGAESVVMTVIAFILGGAITAGLIGVLKSILRSVSLKRPISVAIVGWIMIIFPAVFAVIACCSAPRLASFLSILTAFEIVIGVGILCGWNWCRWAYFVVGGLGLFFSLHDIGPGTILGFIIYPIIVWIFTRPRAKSFFLKTRTSSSRKEM